MLFINEHDTLLPPPNEVCEGYIFTRVCHSVHGVGEYLGRYPPAGTPPWQVYPLAGTPPQQVHPLAGTPPGRYPPLAGTPQACTPPSRYTTPWAGTPPGRYTPGGTPPRQVPHHPGSSAWWEIRATSGRYASYWNAFLFKILVSDINSAITKPLYGLLPYRTWSGGCSNRRLHSRLMGVSGIVPGKMMEQPGK